MNDDDEEFRKLPDLRKFKLSDLRQDHHVVVAAAMEHVRELDSAETYTAFGNVP